MESEITYAEVKFKNESPAAVPAQPQESKPQDAAQKHTKYLPWLIAALLLVLSAALLIALIVTHFGPRTRQSCEDYEVVRQYLRNRSCAEEGSEGKGRVWTCCPMGWELFQASCYYFSNDTMNSGDSARNCTGMGSHLVVISMETEQDFILRHLNGRVTDNKGKSYYIGLTDPEKNDQWRWVDSTPYNGSSVFWLPGEPNNIGTENCATLYVPLKPERKDNRNWNNVPCSEKNNRICETAPLRF